MKLSSTTPNANIYHVKLNGQLLNRCVVADDEEGFVYMVPVDAKGEALVEQNPDTLEWQPMLVRLDGNVTIEPKDAV